jgi:hypothetical protein
MKKYYWCVDAYGLRHYGGGKRTRQECLEALRKQNKGLRYDIGPIMDNYRFFILAVGPQHIDEEEIQMDDALPQEG